MILAVVLCGQAQDGNSIISEHNYFANYCLLNDYVHPPDNEILNQENCMEFEFYLYFKYSFSISWEIFNVKIQTLFFLEEKLPRTQCFILNKVDCLPKQTANNVNWLHSIILCVLHCVYPMLLCCIVDHVACPPNHH